jgi:hypothetical protein
MINAETRLEVHRVEDGEGSMSGRISMGIVLVLAVSALVGGFRTRAFRVGRGRAFRSTALSSSPVAYWITAVVSSVTSGVCAVFILHVFVHV